MQDLIRDLTEARVAEDTRERVTEGKTPFREASVKLKPLKGTITLDQARERIARSACCRSKNRIGN